MYSDGGEVGGAIWTTLAFSYESPLKTLLDSPCGYTLHELLDQDELLQELRSLHPTLIRFFSQERVVEDLVRCLLACSPTDDEETNRRKVEPTAHDQDIDSQQQQQQQQQNRISTTTDPSQHWIYSHTIESASSPLAPSNVTSMPSSSSSTTTTSSSWPNYEDTNHHDPQQDYRQQQDQYEPQSEHDDEYYDKIFIRYPYMACEVICCEIPSILDLLVRGNLSSAIQNLSMKDTSSSQQHFLPPPTSILDLLFTMLDSTTTTVHSEEWNTHHPTTKDPMKDHGLNEKMTSFLDNRRAGYLEKILSILLRERSLEMTSYLNGNHLSTRKTSTSMTTRPTSKNHLDIHTSYDTEMEENVPHHSSTAAAVTTTTSNTWVTTPERITHPPSYHNQDDHELEEHQNRQYSYHPQENQSLRTTTHHSGGGVPLIQCLFHQLHFYSIMQIVQRLLLPQPLSANGVTTNTMTSSSTSDCQYEDRKNNDREETVDILDQKITCNWVDSDVIIDLLVMRLLGKTNEERSSKYLNGGTHNYVDKTMIINGTKHNEAPPKEDPSSKVDAALHASEILINVIQHSPLHSKILRKLTSDPVLGIIIQCACGLDINTSIVSLEKQGSNETELVPLVLGSKFSRHESIMTASIKVLESLVLQLGGYGAVPPPEEGPSSGSERNLEVDEGKMTSDLTALIQHLPFLVRALTSLLIHPDTETWVSPMQFSKTPKHVLGMSRLHIVRLIESLVLLRNRDVDRILYQSDCLEVSLNLMWKFPWCSMLHQSVANLLVHVLEGEEDRIELQRYFLIRCNLQKKLMDSFVSTPVSNDQQSISEFHSAELTGYSLDTTDPSETEDRKADSDFTKSTKKPKPPLQHTLIKVDEESNKNTNEISALLESDLQEDDEIPISDDDIDSAMEQQDNFDGTEKADTTLEETEDNGNKSSTGITTMNSQHVTSSDAAYFQSCDSAPEIKGPLAVRHRIGNLGHIFIICQALEQACNHVSMAEGDPSQVKTSDATWYHQSIHVETLRAEAGNVLESFDADVSRKRKINSVPASSDDGEDQDQKTLSRKSQDNNSLDATETPFCIESYPDKSYHGFGRVPLSFLVESNPIYPQWQVFLQSVLANEAALRTTSVGGSPNHNIGSSIYGGSETYGRQQLHTQVAPAESDSLYLHHESIELDDTDLEVASSMMEALSIPNSEGLNDFNEMDYEEAKSKDRIPSDHSDFKVHQNDTSNVTNKEAHGYLFDDPLGNLSQFTGGYHDDEDMDENEPGPKTKIQRDIDVDSDGEDDVPVMDLYAGNFSFGGFPTQDLKGDTGTVESDWANFDDAFDFSAVKPRDVSTSRVDEFGRNDLFSLTMLANSSMVCPEDPQIIHGTGKST